MSAPTWRGIRTVATLELRQRVRSTRWIVALVVFGLVVAGVTALTWYATRGSAAGYPADPAAGQTMFGFIVFFVLFLGLLVSPTLTATSINGDRNAGTLATLQITLLSAAEIALGKLLAAWLASLAFLGVAVPSILWALGMGGTPGIALVTTLVLLAVMLAVVCAIGLGFSALTARTAGSAVLTYVTVASLTVLSLIVFGLSVPLVSGTETVRVEQEEWTEEFDPDTGEYTYDPGECVESEQEMYVAHTERTWWLLAINPFVIVADAMPTIEARDPYFGGDPMTAIKGAVRSTRLGPPDVYHYCSTQELTYEGWAEDPDDMGPVWPWGLGANLLLGSGGVMLAVRRLRIPQATLPKGTRVA